MAELIAAHSYFQRDKADRGRIVLAIDKRGRKVELALMEPTVPDTDSLRSVIVLSRKEAAEMAVALARAVAGVNR